MGSDMAVVLTKNRPRMLARIVGAVARHHPGMPVIVLDCSAKSAAARNAALVKSAAGGNPAYHVTDAAVGAMRSGLGGEGRRHFDSLVGAAGPRDISGRRNLALVASAALGFSTILCMDDDMEACLPGARCCLAGTVRTRYAGRSNLVVGGRMAGIVDDSYVGRLCRLCEAGRPAVLDSLRAAPPETGAGRGPLWSDPRTVRVRARRVSHSSGGMMAVKVPPDRLLAFPPGYNEDWNWCLLQSIVRGTEVLLDGRPSRHLPPELRDTGTDGIVWESMGDAMFYSLRRAKRKKRRLALADLRDFVVGDISSGSIRGEITRTKNLLDGFIAGGGEGAQLIRHRARLSRAAEALAERDMRRFAEEWFEAQRARTLSLSYILRNGRIKENIRQALEGGP